MFIMTIYDSTSMYNSMLNVNGYFSTVVLYKYIRIRHEFCWLTKFGKLILKFFIFYSDTMRKNKSQKEIKNRISFTIIIPLLIRSYLSNGNKAVPYVQNSSNENGPKIIIVTIFVNFLFNIWSKQDLIKDFSWRSLLEFLVYNANCDFYLTNFM